MLLTFYSTLNKKKHNDFLPLYLLSCIATMLIGSASQSQSIKASQTPVQYGVLMYKRLIVYCRFISRAQQYQQRPSPSTSKDKQPKSVIKGFPEKIVLTRQGSPHVVLLPFQLYDTNVNQLRQADATLVVPNQLAMAETPTPPFYHPLVYCLATKL